MTVLSALMGAEDAPTHYDLTVSDVAEISQWAGWEARWEESGWSPGTKEHDSLASMIREDPAPFLRDISLYYGDEYYL